MDASGAAAAGRLRPAPVPEPEQTVEATVGRREPVPDLEPEQPADRLDPVTDLLMQQAGDPVAPVAVLDDVDGDLTRRLIARGHDPAVWCDDLRAENQVPPAHRRSRLDDTLAGARTVLWRLPKALGAVEEYAELIANHAHPDVRVIAAEREKHLSRSMNTALARSFGTVSASLGHRKARALLAAQPIPREKSWPRRSFVESLSLEMVAHGATFSTNRLDRGTAALAACMPDLPVGERAVDLGCGSGILAALLARQGRQVAAIDVTWSACDAARLTAEANGVDVEVVRQDGLVGWPEPVDLVVINPSFHVRSAKDTTPTRALFAQAGVALVEGGELWCVYNSHLPYLAWLRESIGPTSIVSRDRSYLVTRSVRVPAHRPG